MVKSSLAGVTVVKLESTLSITVHPGSGPPFSQSITGYLKEKTTGTPIANRTSKLWVNGVYKASATTYSDGSYGFFGYSVGEGTYVFDTIFEGDDTYAGSAASKTCTFAKVQAAIAIAVTPTSGLPPLAVTGSGKLTRADTGAGLGGRTVKAYRTDPAGSTKYLGYTTTSIDPATLGNYSFLDTIPSDGAWKYQTEFEGDDGFKGCAEATAPCPKCKHPLEFSEEDVELTCGFCGAALEVVLNG